MQVADILRIQLESKNWSVTELAARARVDRIFVTRLVQPGSTPPRQRSGRLGAERDERYRRIAEALGLDVGRFVSAVQKEQLGNEVVSQDGAVDRYLLEVWAAYRQRCADQPSITVLHQRVFTDVLPTVRERAKAGIGADADRRAGVSTDAFGGTDVERQALFLLAEAFADTDSPGVSAATRISLTRACYGMVSERSPQRPTP